MPLSTNALPSGDTFFTSAAADGSKLIVTNMQIVKISMSDKDEPILNVSSILVSGNDYRLRSSQYLTIWTRCCYCSYTW
jgi:hypothetical protein